MEPTNNDGHGLTYQLGKYFSGVSRHNRLKEQLEQNGFEICWCYVQPIEWDRISRNRNDILYATVKPAVGFLSRRDFWHENQFHLNYAYLLGNLPSNMTLHIGEPMENGLHFVKIEYSSGGSLTSLEDINETSRLEPLVRKVKDICDRL